MSSDRINQGKAWTIALDPLYGLIGMGLLGYGIDYLANTGLTWTISLALLGLVVGFYRFIKDALRLNTQQTRSSPKTDGDPDT
jgi:F0F1-type ATP synthase assembly protein I